MGHIADQMDEREKAWVKSFTLLMENLSTIQCKALEVFGYIPIVASDSSRWLVLPSAVQNAFDVDNEEIYCMTMADREIPPGDVILGVVLSIQDDVDEFRNEAQKIKTKGWMYNSLNSSAYVSSTHMSFLAQNYMPWRREDLLVSEGEWQDFLCCHDENCNLDENDAVCDFHRGAFMMLTLVNDGNTFRTPMQLHDPICRGVESVRRIIQGEIVDHDTMELVFSGKADSLLEAYSSLETWLQEETSRRNAERSSLVRQHGMELGSILDKMVEETFGPEGY